MAIQLKWSIHAHYDWKWTKSTNVWLKAWLYKLKPKKVVSFNIGIKVNLWSTWQNFYLIVIKYLNNIIYAINYDIKYNIIYCVMYLNEFE